MAEFTESAPTRLIDVPISASFEMVVCVPLRRKKFVTGRPGRQGRVTAYAPWQLYGGQKVDT